MFSRKLIVLASLLPFVLAAPVAESTEIDTSSHCGQYDSVTAGQYSLNLDQWGKSSASSGQSCASLTSLSGTTIAWKTTWTWANGSGNGVKSYTDIQLNSGLNKQLSAIKSIPTVWKWSQSSSTVQADVAFDLFTSNSAGGSNVNEIMIWLANINTGPIASSYSSSGAVPYKTGISIAGYTWNLYKGPNGSTTVWSFLPANGQWITSFNTDVNAFLKYLTSQGVSSSQYLKTFQAGTEATSGSATLTTSAYSVTIN